MPRVVNLLPKLRGYSVKISKTASAPRCAACSDAAWLHFALAFTLLPPSLCSTALACCYIHDVLSLVMDREKQADQSYCMYQVNKGL